MKSLENRVTLRQKKLDAICAYNEEIRQIIVDPFSGDCSDWRNISVIHPVRALIELKIQLSKTRDGMMSVFKESIPEQLVESFIQENNLKPQSFNPILKSLLENMRQLEMDRCITFDNMKDDQYYSHLMREQDTLCLNYQQFKHLHKINTQLSQLQAQTCNMNTCELEQLQLKYDHLLPVKPQDNYQSRSKYDSSRRHQPDLSNKNQYILNQQDSARNNRNFSPKKSGSPWNPTQENHSQCCTNKSSYSAKEFNSPQHAEVYSSRLPRLECENHSPSYTSENYRTKTHQVSHNQKKSGISSVSPQPLQSKQHPKESKRRHASKKRQCNYTEQDTSIYEIVDASQINHHKNTVKRQESQRQYTPRAENNSQLFQQNAFNSQQNQCYAPQLPKSNVSHLQSNNKVNEQASPCMVERWIDIQEEIIYRDIQPKQMKDQSMQTSLCQANLDNNCSEDNTNQVVPFDPHLNENYFKFLKMREDIQREETALTKHSSIDIQKSVSESSQFNQKLDEEGEEEHKQIIFDPNLNKNYFKYLQMKEDIANEQEQHEQLQRENNDEQLKRSPLLQQSTQNRSNDYSTSGIEQKPIQNRSSTTKEQYFDQNINNQEKITSNDAVLRVSVLHHSQADNLMFSQTDSIFYCDEDGYILPPDNSLKKGSRSTLAYQTDIYPQQFGTSAPSSTLFGCTPDQVEVSCVRQTIPKFIPNANMNSAQNMNINAAENNNNMNAEERLSVEYVFSQMLLSQKQPFLLKSYINFDELPFGIVMKNQLQIILRSFKDYVQITVDKFIQAVQASESLRLFLNECIDFSKSHNKKRIGEGEVN